MLLAIDCSSKTAAAALVGEDGRLFSEGLINAGLTHSETLMPLIARLLEQARIQPKDIERIAVTNGPGSFTGLRIGAAAAQGLSMSLDIPICGVSSLEAAAWNVAHMGGHIRAVMDARCGQVYTALFRAENGVLCRITPDEARFASEILEKEQILVGDGAEMCYNMSEGLAIAPAHLRYPTGYGVAMAAKNAVFSDELKINYIRIPQAEREKNMRRMSP